MNKQFVHSVFESVAEAHPGREAIRSTGEGVEYSVLNLRANRIAHLIREMGNVPGSIIGVFLPDSIATVVSMLAIWKSGGIYFPLGVELPDRRLESMVTSALPMVILTTDELRPRLLEILRQTDSQISRPRVLILSSDDVITFLVDTRNPKVIDLCDFSSRNPSLDGTGEQSSYLLFTSGSTGQPKGILGRHKSLSHFIHWEIREFGLDKNTRISLLAPPTFDVSLRDILTPLMTGGTLCIPPVELKRSPLRLLEWFGFEGITTIHLVPSLFRLLEKEARESGLSASSLHSVERVLLAGEPLYGADVNRWRETFGNGIDLVNLYGPTESTLAKLFYRIDPEPQVPNQIIPIGQPIANTAALILKNGALCRIGEEGEIHIKTPFLSNGYHADPINNAEWFIQNPLNQEQEDTLFRTGDLGRYQQDRSVVFTGRLDFQVKIHGNRVEPGEIESLLVGFEGVTQAVVLPQEMEDHSWTLSAFYTSNREIAPDDFTGYLTDRLPGYMIPGRFNRLEAFPLTANGKIDRRQLAQIAKDFQREMDFQPPSTKMEKILASIWGEVIGVERVSVNARFFEIGGHSLHAIRIVSRLQKVLGIELSIQDFFAHPILRNQALYLQSLAKNDAATIPCLPDSEDGYPLSPAQRRLWTLFQIDPQSVAYAIQSAVSLDGELDLDSFYAAWQEIVQRHEALRTRFFLHKNEPRQRVEDLELKLPVIDLSNDPHQDQTIKEIIRSDFATPFDLTAAPLIRIKLIRMTETKHVFLLNIHHIICDAWSLDVIAYELGELYNRNRGGNAKALPPLQVQYRDYAAWANERLASTEFEQARAYWLNRFQCGLPQVDIPGDRLRPPVRTFSGSTLDITLPDSTKQALRTLSGINNVTPFVVMLSALKTLIFRLTNQREIVVGTTIANRTLTQLEDQVGFYVNTLPLLDYVDGAQNFVALLRQIQTTMTEAFQQQSYPFDRLVEELDLQRDVSRNPLFDVALIHHADRQQFFTMDGLTVVPFPFGSESAKYDLLLSFEDRNDQTVLQVNFNTDIFDISTIKRYLRYLITLVEEGTNHPDVPVSALRLMDEEEITQLLSSGKGAIRIDYLGRTIVELFESQVSSTPEAPALISGNDEWSYREISDRASSISSLLLTEMKLPAGTVVAVNYDRSPFGIFALLGVMKAGCVYFPIDPELPDERLVWLLKDSGCGVLLTDLDRSIELPDEVSIIDLRTMDYRAHNTASNPVSPDDPAYIIYTSGTTGQPKGVLVEHGSFCNMILSQIEAWSVTPGERVLQFASAAFDASLSEIFMALLSGAALILTTRDTIANPERFTVQIERDGITILTLPPVYLTALGQQRLPSVRTLISAGEAAIEPLLRFHAETADCWNAYGPSECSVCTTFHRFDPTVSNVGNVSIGRPIPNLEVLILDSQNNLLPIGVPGELCIAGTGLARGYIGKTAESNAFQSHPFGADGERIYRTGDRARWRAGGTLEFLGRIDQQVKVRGHRIEPSEVANVLLKHPNLIKAVVGTVGEGSENELVAWVCVGERIELWPSVAEFYIYDDVLYRAMFTDEERNNRYRAVFQTYLPGKTVLEIGPGPEAILSQFAIEAGAKKVYAVELLEETWRKAKARIAELGLANQIEVINADLLNVELPEKVDVCISEIVGAIGGSEGSARLINHARRFLVDPSQMIPSRSLTHIAAVAFPLEEELRMMPEIAAHYVERIFAEAGHPFDLRLSVKNFPRKNILSDSGIFEDLDYTREIPLESEHEVRLPICREGVFHGFLTWLELFIDPDHSIDILDHAGSWLPVYVPIYLEGIPVRTGDAIKCGIKRKLSENGLNPDFYIEGVIVRDKVEVVHFEQAIDHLSDGFRVTPFYKKIFTPEGKVASLPDATASGLRRYLQSRLPDYMIPSRFIFVENIPQTPNGKVDFNALKRLLVTQENDTVQRPPRSDQEKTIAIAVAAVTGVKGLNIDEDLFAQGLDSIRAIQLVARLKETGLHLEVRDVFRHPTIERLSVIARNLGHHIDQGTVTGEVIATPIQRWFFATHRVAPHHFNQSVLLMSVEPINDAAFQKTIDALLEHHDALRMVVRKIGNNPQQEILNTVKLDYNPIDLRSDPDSLTPIVSQLQAGFDLEGSPLFRVARFLLPEGERLLLIAHHLIVDGISWRILLEDLERGYEQAIQGQSIILPLKSDSFKRWGEALRQAADQGVFESERDFWDKVDTAEVPVLPGYTGDVRLTNRVESRVVSDRLESKTTRLLLTSALYRYNTEVNDLLLTALVRSLKRWFGAEKVRIALEGHGREELFDRIEVTRTVGWFTALYPVLIDLEGIEETGYQIKQVKETLRTIPNRGVGYGILRWMHPPVEGVSRNPAPEISFNYLGQVDNGEAGSFFRIIDEPSGPEISPESELEAELGLVCVVIEGELKIEIRYNSHRFTEETVTHAVRFFVEELGEVVRHCCASGERELTPSDLTYDGFTIESLDDFMDDLDLE